MDMQLLREVIFIGIVVFLTGIGYYRLRYSRLTKAQKLERVFTGFIGGFVLMAGTVKFFEPFNSMFISQIKLSELPFPELSRVFGQLGEITVGLSLLSLIFFKKKLSGKLSNLIFYFGNFGYFGIMSVAFYVHLHPNVPAEILPMATKPPVMTIVTMIITVLNIYLHRVNKYTQT